MIRAPFDPIAPLAAEFHGDAHGGDACASEPAQCPAAVGLALSLRARLAAGGLVVARREVIAWATRLVDAVDDEAVREQASPPTATDSERRSREVVWVRLRHRADPPTRLGPYQRWLGELVLGDISLAHGPDVIGAVLEPEAGWIGDLVGSLEI